MCMVIHELATNATKYGALSSDDGFIVVTTDVQSKDGSIQLTWAESDGPTISSEITEGTGTSLLQGLVDHEMHGKITMNYASEGLVCQIEVPLDTNS